MSKEAQEQVDYIADKLLVNYEVISNISSTERRTCKAQLTFINSGDQNIKHGRWFVYFYHFRMIERFSLLRHGVHHFKEAGLLLEHVNGVLFRLGPSLQFKPLIPGGSLRVPFSAQQHVISRSDIQPNWYVTGRGLEPRLLKCTAGETLDFLGAFDTPEKWKRSNKDKYNPLTPEKRFDECELLSDVEPQLVIPSPRTVRELDLAQHIQLDSSWRVQSTKSTANEARFLADALRLEVVDTELENKLVELKLIASLDEVTSDEGYVLQVDAEKQTIIISAIATSGLFYGVQTLLSLAANDAQIPHVHLQDEPRYAYRGMHLDVARNFVPKDQVLKLLEAMAMYKMNKLHFHLTDDEGWRLEIPGLPELTEVGARRCHSEKLDSLQPQLGSGPFDNTSGSGYYSVQDYQEILRFAEARHIQVIPEIDMPGHSHAAIRSMEARFERLRKSDPAAASKYRLIEPEDDGAYLSVQSFSDDAVNPGLPSTYTFVAKVMDELISMHKPIQPLRIFHYGGDEVALAWTHSAACQKLVGTRDVTEEEAHHIVMQHFVHKVAELTAARDLRLGCWEDGAMDDDDEPYDLRKLGTTGSVYANAWMNIWEAAAASRAYRLANAGYKVIMSQATHLYFDHPYEPDPEERGLYWATRCIDTKKTFGFMPDNLYANADVTRMGLPITEAELGKGATEPLKRPENIIGMQAHLWTETVRTNEQRDAMIWPRLIAVAERSWYRAEWESQSDLSLRQQQRRHDWNRFAAALGVKESRRLEAMSVDYRIPPPGARLCKDGAVELSCAMPGLPIQYCSGASDIWHDYSVLFRPANEELRLRTLSQDRKRNSRIVKFRVQRS